MEGKCDKEGIGKGEVGEEGEEEEGEGGRERG